MQLRPYQSEACNAIVRELSKDGVRKTLLILPTGCHDPDQGILLANGSIKLAKNIKVGDKLMGPDGKERNVLKTITGIGNMYKVTPIKGSPFIVDENHILSLTTKGGNVCNVSVKEYLTWSNKQKHLYKLYRSYPKKKIKNVMRTGFSVESIGKGEYCGFTVDKDNLYLMDDFTVTHNCGKTIVFSGIANYFAYPKKGGRLPIRILILAHQNILLEQAEEKLEKVLGIKVTREKGRESSLKSDLPITVSTVQTMTRRIDRFDPDHFGLIIVDECHHVQSKNYQKILDHFTGAKILGVTATPYRSDKKKINFDSIAYRYTIAKAQEQGYLSPIVEKMGKITIDLKDVRKKNGDLESNDLGLTIEAYLHKIAEETRRLAKGRKIVCFVPLIRTAKKAAEIFSHYGFDPAWTSGDDPFKDQKLKDFSNGRYDIIFNSMLLTEGWDCPSTDCVIILRPTSSQGLYTQMLGRGLRLSEGKKDCLLISFFFQNCAITPVKLEEVLGESWEEDEKEKQKREVPEWMTRQPGDREETLRKKLEEAARIESSLKDPLGDPKLKEIILTARKEALESELMDSPCSKSQREKIQKLGYRSTDLSYSEAKAVLAWHDQQRPPTDKQIYRLRRLGFGKQEIAKMNFAQAMKEIRRSKAMGRW